MDDFGHYVTPRAVRRIDRRADDVCQASCSNILYYWSKHWHAKTYYKLKGPVRSTSMATGELNNSADSKMTSVTDSSEVLAAAADASASKPTCIIILGMAGSGKTTFVQVVRWQQ
jgi:polynucleotide 5'-kinase involved in rRNA processing